MELKNAASVCLIALFSATLVVLIARLLDSQAASQLEPQLTKIADELEALRKQGETAETIGNGLVVYYFHSNNRCPTCRAIESQTKELLDANFAAQSANNEIVWKVLNFEKPVGKPLAARFEIKDPVVVLARMKDGEVAQWKRLDNCMALASDKDAFKKYVQEGIQQMLAKEKQSSPADSSKTPPAIPIPDAK